MGWNQWVDVIFNDPILHFRLMNFNKMAFRVGINSGPLVAGVIGQAKYQYDLWGDTVNLASRMESHGAAGKVHVSPSTYDLIKESFDCASRGNIPIKGKGEMETWYVLDRKKPEQYAFVGMNLMAILPIRDDSLFVKVI